MVKGLFIGAYASSPSFSRSSWLPAEEKRYMAGLRRLDGVAGLEHPFCGTLHPWDERAFLESLDPRWSIVLTGLPGVMPRLRADPDFGLASSSADGRRRALDFMQAALKAVGRINEHFGRAAVPGVFLHSAPRKDFHCREAFAQSLAELRSWNWQGASLFVEHCDRQSAGWNPDKGFLPLEDELWALSQTEAARAAPAKMLVNWGRSAVEQRSAAGPLAHVKACKAAGRLGGLMFSGCTPSHPLYGDWKDSHAPFRKDEPASLMGEAEARDCLQAAGWGDLEILGFKIAARPDEAPLELKLDLLASSLGELQGCLKAESP